MNCTQIEWWFWHWRQFVWRENDTCTGNSMHGRRISWLIILSHILSKIKNRPVIFLTIFQRTTISKPIGIMVREIKNAIGQTQRKQSRKTCFFTLIFTLAFQDCGRRFFQFSKFDFKNQKTVHFLKFSVFVREQNGDKSNKPVFGTFYSAGAWVYRENAWFRPIFGHLFGPGTVLSLWSGIG